MMMTTTMTMMTVMTLTTPIMRDKDDMTTGTVTIMHDNFHDGDEDEDDIGADQNAPIDHTTLIWE